MKKAKVVETNKREKIVFFILFIFFVSIIALWFINRENNEMTGVSLAQNVETKNINLDVEEEVVVSSTSNRSINQINVLTNMIVTTLPILMIIPILITILTIFTRRYV